MAPWSGLKLLKIQENVFTTLAIEFLIAGAAFKLNSKGLKPAYGTGMLLKEIKDVVLHNDGDRELSTEINKLKDIVKDRKIFKKLKDKNYLEC